MSNDQLTRLVDELKELRLREDIIVQQIESLLSAPGNTPTSVKQEPKGHAIAIGDTVQFKPTQSTKGGTGIVIGFTNGDDPFARIRRSGSKSGSTEVRRKPRNLTKHV